MTCSIYPLIRKRRYPERLFELLKIPREEFMAGGVLPSPGHLMDLCWHFLVQMRLAWLMTNIVLLSTLIEIIPLKYLIQIGHGFPGIAWSTDSKTLYYSSHTVDPGFSSPEESPIFDIKAYLLPSGPSILLASDIGLFTYPKIPLIDE